MRLRLMLTLGSVMCQGQNHGHCQCQQGLSVVYMVDLMLRLELGLCSDLGSVFWMDKEGLCCELKGLP